MTGGDYEQARVPAGSWGAVGGGGLHADRPVAQARAGSHAGKCPARPGWDDNGPGGGHPRETWRLRPLPRRLRVLLVFHRREDGRSRLGWEGWLREVLQVRRGAIAGTPFRRGPRP